MQEVRLQSKYVITKCTAEQIRKRVHEHLKPDRHAVSHPDLCYPVHSVYFDSSALESYWATVQRLPNRLKLRIRFYGDGPCAPLSAEMKRRVDGRTVKHRSELGRLGLDDILACCSAMQVRQPMAPASDPVLRQFIETMRLPQARPKLHVAYRRAAYVSDDDNLVRLTLDSEIRSEVVSAFRFSTRMERPRLLCGGLTVLELKCKEAPAAWFGTIAEEFQLRESSFAKYVSAISAHGLVTPSK